MKKEVAEGVDVMVVRELTGGLVFMLISLIKTFFFVILNLISIVFNLSLGIYFGQPRGFSTNDIGEEIGFNTEVYSAPEVTT